MCPVSGGLALAAAVGATGATATAVAVVGAAAIGAGIGVAVNAGVNLATGRGAFDNWGKAAAFGAVSAGIGSYTSGTDSAFFSQAVNPTYLEQAAGYASSLGSWHSVALSTATGSLMNAMAPSNVGYTPVGAYNQQAQALNMNTNIATTGSGGRQAAKSLATAISRTKKRKLTQDDIGDLSLDTSSFTNTGLQLA